MKPVKAWWFTGRETIGIVLGEDETTGKKKAYIGTASGFNEDADMKSILRNGSKINKHVAKHLLEQIDEE